MSSQDSELEEGEINGDEGCNDTAVVGTSSSAFQDALKDIQKRKSQNQRSTLSDRNQGRYPAAYSKNTAGKSKDRLRKIIDEKRKLVGRPSVRQYLEDSATWRARRLKKTKERAFGRLSHSSRRKLGETSRLERETSRNNSHRSSNDDKSRHNHGSSAKPTHKPSDRKNHETETTSDFTKKSKRVTEITQCWKTRDMDVSKVTRTVSSANGANKHSPSPTHNENTPRTIEPQNEHHHGTSNGGSTNQMTNNEHIRARILKGDANGDKILIKPFSNDKDDEIVELPIVKEKPEPELIVIDSSDEGEVVEEDEVDDGVEELELRRVALEGLYNNLEHKERSESVEELEVEEDIETLRSRLLADMANKSNANKAHKKSAESEKQPWKKTFKPVTASTPNDQATRRGGLRPASGTTQNKSLRGNSAASSTETSQMSRRTSSGNSRSLRQNPASASTSPPISHNYGHVNMTPNFSQATLPYTPDNVKIVGCTSQALVLYTPGNVSESNTQVSHVRPTMPTLLPIDEIHAVRQIGQMATTPPMPILCKLTKSHQINPRPPASSSRVNPRGLRRSCPSQYGQHPGDLAGRQLSPLDDRLMPVMSGLADEGDPQYLYYNPNRLNTELQTCRDITNSPGDPFYFEQGMRGTASPPQPSISSELVVYSTPKPQTSVIYSVSPNGTARVCSPLKNSFEKETTISMSGSLYQDYMRDCHETSSKPSDDDPENTSEDENYVPNSPPSETDISSSNLDNNLSIVTNAHRETSLNGESMVVTTAINSLKSNNTTGSVNNSVEKFQKMNRNVVSSASSSSVEPGPSSSVPTPPAGVNIPLIDISAEPDSTSSASNPPPAAPLPAAPHPAPPSAADVPIIMISPPESGVSTPSAPPAAPLIIPVIEILPPTSPDTSSLGAPKPYEVITLSSSPEESSPLSAASSSGSDKSGILSATSSSSSNKISPFSTISKSSPASSSSTSSDCKSNGVTPASRRIPASKRLFVETGPNCDDPSHSKESEMVKGVSPNVTSTEATSLKSTSNTALHAVGEESQTTKPSVPQASSGDLPVSVIGSKEKVVLPPSTSQTGKTALISANTSALAPKSSIVQDNRAKVTPKTPNRPQSEVAPDKTEAYKLRLGNYKPQFPVRNPNKFRTDNTFLRPKVISAPVTYMERQLPIKRFVIRLGNDSSSEEETDSSSPRSKVRALASVEEGNSSSTTVRPNFNSSLDAMLKSMREKAELNKASTDAVQTLNVDKSKESRSDKSADKSSSQLSSDPTSVTRIEKENAGEKEELELREKLLRATLVKKVKNSKMQMDLAKAEKMLISKRRLATGEFKKLHSCMIESKDQRKSVKDCEQKIKALKEHLEKEEKRLIKQKRNANKIIGEVKSASKKAQDMRTEVLEWQKKCEKIGFQFSGRGYNVPVQGEASLYAIVVDVAKQVAIVKAMKENNSDTTVIPVGSPMPATSIPSAIKPSSGQSVPYYIDLTGDDEQAPEIIVPNTNFSTVLGVNEECGESSRLSDALPSTFNEYKSPFTICISKGKK